MLLTIRSAIRELIERTKELESDFSAVVQTIEALTDIRII
jgi:hypothetical protein